jgi:hypothetical protein
MKVGFVSLNSGGTMGHMTITTRAADHLIRDCGAECIFVCDHDFRPYGPPACRQVAFAEVPQAEHQYSVGGCLNAVPVPRLLDALTAFGCNVAIFSTFFSVDAVRAVNDAGICPVLLTFPLRDSHWAALGVQDYWSLFQEILVLSDLYEPTVCYANQRTVAPLCQIGSESVGSAMDTPQVLVVVGGGGRPSSQRMLELVREAAGELSARGISLDWAVSHGTTCPASTECWGRTVRWEPDLPSWIGRYDLVLSEAGYNTVSELLSIGQPSLLIPGHRRIDNQELRALNYEGSGCGVCCLPEQGAAELADKVEQLLAHGKMGCCVAEARAVFEKMRRHPTIGEAIARRLPWRLT